MLLTMRTFGAASRRSPSTRSVRRVRRPSAPAEAVEPLAGQLSRDEDARSLRHGDSDASPSAHRQSLSDGEDDEGIWHVQRLQPRNVDLNDDGLQDDEGDEHGGHGDDDTAEVAGDGQEEHGDRCEGERRRAQESVRVDALTAERAEAAEEELDDEGDEK